MKDNDQKNILICPLAWGTGHATRVQVVAWELKRRGHKIIIAAPPSLHKTFDTRVYDKMVSIWSPTVSYSKFLPPYLAVLLQLPVMLTAFFSDRLSLPRLIRNYGIDLVISDNRFGMWSHKVYSVYITHQLRVAVPRAFTFVGPLVSAIHRSVARRYNECWIPDLPGLDNLSGMLSHDCRLPPATRYTGILSRFSKQTDPSLFPVDRENVQGSGFLSSQYTLALLSGPEPQRRIFENLIISLKDRLPGSLVIVAGKPGDDKENKDDALLRYPWLDGLSLYMLMKNARLIICRPGYSTMMDLFTLGRTALLVPTPGQPEQEYLADYLSGKYGFNTIKQKQLKGEFSIPDTGKDLIWKGDERLLDKALDDLLRK